VNRGGVENRSTYITYIRRTNANPPQKSKKVTGISKHNLHQFLVPIFKYIRNVLKSSFKVFCGCIFREMARYRLIRVSPQHVTITGSSAHASALGSACYSRSLPSLLAGFNTQDSRRWSRCSRFTVLFIGVEMEQYRTTYVHYTLYAISRRRRSSRTVHQGLPSLPEWHSFNRRDLSRLHHRIECQYHL